MPSRQDLALLKWSLLCLLLAAGAAFFLACYGQKKFDGQRRELRVAQQRLEQARRTTADAEAERKEAERYLPAYEAVLQRGIFSDDTQESDARLHLRAIMESLRERYPLPDFSYAIQPPRTAALPAIEDYEMRQHGMTMRFALLHEGQLLDFLDALQHEPDALFALERCAIERRGDALNADCAGNWITLAKKAKT